MFVGPAIAHKQGLQREIPGQNVVRVQMVFGIAAVTLIIVEVQEPAVTEKEVQVRIRHHGAGMQEQYMSAQQYPAAALVQQHKRSVRRIVNRHVIGSFAAWTATPVKRVYVAHLLILV